MGGGFLWRQKSRLGSSQRERVLADVDWNLTKEQKKIYTDRIEQANNYLASLSPSQPGFALEVSSVYVFLGQQYYGLGLLHKSKEMYELALKKDSNSENAIAGLALTLTTGGDKEGARELLEKSLKDIPGNRDIWLQLIQLRRGMGASNEEITSLYGQALLNTDRHIDIITSNGKFFADIGKNSEAISLWQEAAKKNPDNAAAYQSEIDRLKSLSK